MTLPELNLECSSEDLLTFQDEYMSQASISTILDMKLELTVQSPYPPQLRRPPYPSRPKS